LKGLNEPKYSTLTMGTHWDTLLNINSNIKNKRQDCKIGTVGGIRGMEEGEWRRLSWGYMVDGLHMPIWNRTNKSLAIALRGTGRELRGRDNGDDVTNVQYKLNKNCHYESPYITNIS
jgi:hypothetical protein